MKEKNFDIYNDNKYEILKDMVKQYGTEILEQLIDDEIVNDEDLQDVIFTNFEREVEKEIKIYE